MTVKSVLKDPFVHFLLLGGLLFAADAWWGALDDGIDREVVVTGADIARLEALWEAQYSKPPAAAELTAIIDNHVKEEVLYREAMALGLADDDVIVRRRLVQKYLFLSEGLMDQAAPDGARIAAYYDAHPKRYRTPATTSLRHVYVSDERRGAMARADAAALVTRLAADDRDWRALGDPFMLPRAFADRTDDDLRALLGPDFMTGLAAQAVDRWAGPVRSAYGWHAVWVTARNAETRQPLDAVRDQIVTDMLADRRQAASRAFYAQVRDRYRVTIEGRTGASGP